MIWLPHVLPEHDTVLNSASAVTAVLQMTGADPEASELWKSVLESARSPALTAPVQRVVGLQWAVWLANCQLKTIQEYQVHFCLYPQFVYYSTYQHHR